MAGTGVNISGAGFVQNAGFSVLNNSAVQEANQNQGITKFIIGSDSKSIEQNYSRENLMPEPQSPGTAMNLNENSRAMDIVDPTQIIYI
jgi:hypothetical protein|tara:strand:- start:145 stop:411 length:267 start_codon:yes stop_codon:yes gene_type:complete